MPAKYKLLSHHLGSSTTKNYTYVTQLLGMEHQVYCLQIYSRKIAL